MPIKPLVEPFGNSCAAKRNARSAMPVAVTGGARLWAEDPLASDPSTLKLDFQIDHWEGDTVLA